MRHIYLASPYTSPRKYERLWRFNLVCEAAGLLMQQGHQVFSPIAHCHPIADMCTLPHDFEYWKSYNRSMMEKWATELCILQLPGWDTSIGVRAEFEMALELNYSVTHISDAMMQEWRRGRG